MKRRSFISMLTGAAGALFVPQWRIPDPVIVLPPKLPRHVMYAMGYAVTEGEMEPLDNLYGFGLAQLKPEGGVILYDPVIYDKNNLDNIRKILEPGLRAAWDEHYRSAETIEVFTREYRA